MSERLDIRAAAEALAAARAEGRKLDAPPGPETIDWDQAYAVQDALIEIAGSPLFGWKIGATSQRAQARLKVDGPFIGPIFERYVHEAPGPVALHPQGVNVIEPEFAFRMAADLPARPAGYSEAEVEAAAGALHAALEIVDRRLAEPPGGHGFTCAPGWFAADAGANGGFVPGPGRADWRTLDLPALTVSVTLDGAPKTEGVAANALGSPLAALTWAANHLSRRGLGLRAGQWVTTGLVTEIFTAAPGQTVAAAFEELGTVEAAFTA